MDTAFEKKMDTQFEFIAGLIKTAHDDLSERIDGLEERFDGLETKVIDIDARLAQLSVDVKGNTQSIKHLTEQVDNLNGLPKEIDYAFTRIAALEKHAGLQPAIMSPF